MSSADAKRWALGLLAGFSALPLPLNEPRPEGVVGWGYLFLFELGVVLFLLRVQRGEQRWLKPWMLNVLGVVYLPLLVFDLGAISRGQLLRPMMHLALFVVLVKLFSLVAERDKWPTLMAVFFVFVTAMATSTSPFIVVYLLGFLLLAVRVLDGFAQLHLSSLGRPVSTDGGSLGKGRRLAWSLVVGSLLLAAPMFFMLPRFANPFVLGRAQSASNTAAGFSDEAGLNGIGSIRDSQDVALRIEAEGQLSSADLRLRGATFDRFQGDHWDPSGGVDLVERRSRQGPVRLARDQDLPVVRRARVARSVLRARAVILPSTAVEVEFEGNPPPLLRGSGGALATVSPPRTSLLYEVGLASRPVYPDDLEAGSYLWNVLVSREGISARVERLADDITEDVPDANGPMAEARAIEQHLVDNYAYTLDLVGRSSTSPIEEFLFEEPSGHCEYFASSMVLLLRSRGIPARYVTGFLGAEQSLGYWIVRQNNAHAWVEAWIEGHGWETFDPTPPDGRPTSARRSAARLLMQAWDLVVYRWDSSIIAFSQGDQFRLFARFRRWIQQRFGGGLEQAAPVPQATEGSGARSSVALPEAPSEAATKWVRATIPVTFLLTGLMIGWWIVRKPPLDPAMAYRRLVPLAARLDVVWDGALAPREFERRFVAVCPGAAGALRDLIGRYLEQSFSGRPLLDPTAGRRERRQLAAELEVLLGNVRSAVRERRKELRNPPERRQRRGEDDERQAS